MNGHCIYRDSCTLTDTDKCSTDCFRYTQMHKLLEMSNLPENKWRVDILSPSIEDVETWQTLHEIKKNIASWVSQGRSLYLYSQWCGNGKTSWAIRMLLSYLNSVWGQPVLRPRAVFMPVSQLFDKERENIDRPTDEYYALRKSLFTADLVVFDDLGSTRVTEFNQLTLLNIIDARENAGLSTIYTANIGGSQVGDLLGQRLESRIWNASYKVRFKSSIDRRVRD